MRVLLDTQTFLWWDRPDPRLSDAARSVIDENASEIYVSVVSAWEMAIKVAKGTLQLPLPIAAFIPTRLVQYRFRTLPVVLGHAIRVAELPRIHADPFDRMLVAQAQEEGLAIVTSDPAIGRYDVETIW